MTDIKRTALLIGNSQFSEDKLSNLRCPLNDVKDMARVLNDKGRGGFDVIETLENEDSYSARRKVHSTLRNLSINDLLLFYYSGHGKRSLSGDLYLTTSDTVVDELESTAIALKDIYNFVQQSPCKTVVLVLDCCYSGAAGSSLTKDSLEDQLRINVEGSGTYLMTASTGIQTALEKEEDNNSVFTKYLISGIETGEADIDGNGYVTLDELYEYAHKKVKASSHQEPTRWSFDQRGSVIISRSGRQPRVERAESIQALLFDLKIEDRIDALILSEAIHIVESLHQDLDDNDQQKDQLLGKLLDKGISAFDFGVAWKTFSPLDVPPSPPSEPEETDEGGIEAIPKKTDFKAVFRLMWLLPLLLLSFTEFYIDDEFMIVGNQLFVPLAAFIGLTLGFGWTKSLWWILPVALLRVWVNDDITIQLPLSVFLAGWLTSVLISKGDIFLPWCQRLHFYTWKWVILWGAAFSLISIDLFEGDQLGGGVYLDGLTLAPVLLLCVFFFIEINKPKALAFFVAFIVMAFVWLSGWELGYSIDTVFIGVQGIKISDGVGLILIAWLSMSLRNGWLANSQAWNSRFCFSSIGALCWFGVNSFEFPLAQVFSPISSAYAASASTVEQLSINVTTDSVIGANLQNSVISINSMIVLALFFLWGASTKAWTKESSIVQGLLLIFCSYLFMLIGIVIGDIVGDEDAFSVFPILNYGALLLIGCILTTQLGRHCQSRMKRGLALTEAA